MGIRVAIVISATSFLLGCFFTHWIADSITLWQTPLTDAHLYSAAAYYSILSTMPRWMDALLVVIMTAAALALILSFWDGQAGNLMFDGASTFLSTCALVVWVYSCLPNIDRLAERIPHSGPFPLDLKRSTLEIANKNLVCSVALTGVILLQAGRQTSENKDTSADPSLIKVVNTDTSALALDDTPSDLPDLKLPEMPRGRRRSHHDHLEADLDNASTSSSTSSLRSESVSSKRDGSRRTSARRSIGGSNRNKPAFRAGEASLNR